MGKEPFGGRGLQKGLAPPRDGGGFPGLDHTVGRSRIDDDAGKGKGTQKEIYGTRNPAKKSHAANAKSKREKGGPRAMCRVQGGKWQFRRMEKKIKDEFGAPADPAGKGKRGSKRNEPMGKKRQSRTPQNSSHSGRP